MEPAIGAFLGDEWDALCKMFTSEDSDLLLQLHGDVLPSNECLYFPNQSIFFPIDEGNQNVGNLDGNSQCFDVLEYLNFHNVSHGTMDENNNNNNNNANMVSSYLDVGGMEEMVNSPKEDVGSDKFANVDAQKSRIADSGTRHLLKRKLDSPQVPAADDAAAVVGKCISNSAEIPAKKPRVCRNKSKRNNQSKTKKSMIKGKEISNEEEGNVSSYCSSEDDSKTSMESNGGLTSDSKEELGLSFKGKTRASRGSATDPQSLYARRRRERINERLRILQNLIPNGTKVDISTMLEEAVHYVKFLQLQIKLLSSNDSWMYAPIGYNGIDLGMYNKIIPNL